MKISLIAAVARRNGVIGDGKIMPWHLPADLQYFKRRTQGKPVIMGRKTYESIGRPLPERWNIIVSRQTPPSPLPEKVYWVINPEAALDVCRQLLVSKQSSPSSAVPTEICETEAIEEVMVIGGGEIYHHFFPHAERLYITWVETYAEGEVRFPEIDFSQWRCVSRESRLADQNNSFDCEFVVYERQTHSGMS